MQDEYRGVMEKNMNVTKIAGFVLCFAGGVIAGPPTSVFSIIVGAGVGMFGLYVLISKS